MLIKAMLIKLKNVIIYIIWELEGMMMKRMLNVAFAIETIHARLNGSSPEVEFQKDNYKNTTYTKKIGGKGMVSAVCQK